MENLYYRSPFDVEIINAKEIKRLGDFHR